MGRERGGGKMERGGEERERGGRERGDGREYSTTQQIPHVFQTHISVHNPKQVEG